jgi:CheY-like chemotaxis protein
LASLKILHVEDDADIREISRIALEMVGGHEVHQFFSGTDAINAALSINPDVFLLDVMMPEMSGQETLLGLRSLPGCQEIPAIFMTGKAYEAELADLRAAGAIDVIVKPFNPMTLADQIAEIVSRVS